MRMKKKTVKRAGIIAVVVAVIAAASVIVYRVRH